MLKAMASNLNCLLQIILYCDLHGHSRKHMVFMYGCERKALRGRTKTNLYPGASSDGDDPFSDAKNFVEERLFPWLIYKLTPQR